MHNIENQIRAEVERAYCDARIPWGQAKDRRQLMFKASMPVAKGEAIRIMRAMVPGGYNGFDADLLAMLPPQSRVTLAREYSVCVYVTPPVKPIAAMKASEWDTKDGVTRIWWD
jgi:hypothetical protein